MFILSILFIINGDLIKCHQYIDLNHISLYLQGFEVDCDMYTEKEACLHFILGKENVSLFILKKIGIFYKEINN
jgi:hypothetical protein